MSVGLTMLLKPFVALAFFTALLCVRFAVIHWCPAGKFKDLLLFPCDNEGAAARYAARVAAAEYAKANPAPALRLAVLRKPPTPRFWVREGVRRHNN